MKTALRYYSARRQRRRPRGISPGPAIAAVILGFVVLQTALNHLLISIVVLLVIGTVSVTVGRHAYKRTIAARGALAGVDPHRMDPQQFEHFLADLCRRDGCHNVRVVGGANDLAADVLYTDPNGRPGLIQAKRYRTGNAVGSEHVQMVNGTYRDAHGCDHASIVTTSHFTPAALDFARRVRIDLVDAQRLNAWQRGGPRYAPWN